MQGARRADNRVAVKTYLQVSRNQTGMYFQYMRISSTAQRRRWLPQ